MDNVIPSAVQDWYPHCPTPQYALESRLSMGDNSAIEWTDATWNPVTGCTKVSPGCKYCYAERLAIRLKAMGNRRYKNGFDLTLHPDQLELPLKWRQPRRIFVNSMSDLFHEEIAEEYIEKVFEVMNKASWHNFQILTKRAARLAALATTLTWGPNIWQGVSVEGPAYVSRIAHLQTVPALWEHTTLHKVTDVSGNDAIAVRVNMETGEVKASLPRSIGDVPEAGSIEENPDVKTGDVTKIEETTGSIIVSIRAEE